MTTTFAITVAALLQFALRTTLFVEQCKDLCSPAPSISSWIFLIALLDLISDLSLYPVRYMHLPYFCQMITETVVAILLTEFGSIVVWCTLEKLFCRLAKSILLIIGLSQQTYTDYEYLILGVVTTSISLMILAYVGQATDHFHILRRKYHRIERKVMCYLEMLWNQVKGGDSCGRRARNRYARECCCRNYEDAPKCSPRRRKSKRY